MLRELTALIERRGKPGMIVSDNGTELTSNAILRWCPEHRIEWHYIAPGEPMQNRRRLSRTAGVRLLHETMFRNQAHACRDRDPGRRLQYREYRASPHSALDDRPAADHARALTTAIARAPLREVKVPRSGPFRNLRPSA